MRSGAYPLFGGRFSLDTRREWFRTLLGGLWFLGPPVWGMRLAGRAGARQLLHALERDWARRVARWLGLRLELEGLERINRTQAYIVVPLHEGFADVVVLLHLPLALRFVARDELFEWRVLGGYLRDTGQIVVPTGREWRGYRELLRAGRAVLEAGESLVVFPQGSILGVEIAFQPGAFRLAERLGYPLLPVVLTGSHRVWAWPFSSRLRYGQRVSLRVLPPVPAREVRARGVEAVRRALQAEMKRHALAGGMSPPRRFVPEVDGYWEGYAYEIDPMFPELARKVQRHREGSGRLA